MRNFEAFSAPGKSDVFARPIGDLQPGETLTRIRFNYEAAIVGVDQPFYTEGINYLLAFQLYPATLAVPDRSPVSHQDDSWIWWESCYTRTQIWGLDKDLRQVTYAAGPVDGGTRDGKAQRRNDSGAVQKLWLQMEAAPGGAQAGLFLSFAVSALIIEAGP